MRYVRLSPDYYFGKFDEITVDFLMSLNIKGLILDIDNTLEPYENAYPGERVLAWLDELKKAGISTSIVSNNNKERVEKFNRDIKLPCYFKAGKPFKKNLIKAMIDMKTSCETTAIVGDQIFTDVWAGKNAGIKSVLVPPIKDKTDIFTRFKRLMERPILKKFFKLNKDGSKE